MLISIPTHVIQGVRSVAPRTIIPNETAPDSNLPQTLSLRVNLYVTLPSTVPLVLPPTRLHKLEAQRMQ